MYKSAKTTGYVLLLLSSIVSSLRMLRASGWNLEIWQDCAWVVLPYVIFFCVSFLMKKSPLIDLSICITSLFMLIFTFLFYIDISSTSTACLIFLFAPFYLSIGSPVLFGISFLIAKKIVFKKNKF
jgi:hypothetical protein